MSTDLPQSPFPFAWNCCRIRDGNAGHRITVYLYKNMAMSIHKHLSSDQKSTSLHDTSAHFELEWPGNLLLRYICKSSNYMVESSAQKKERKKQKKEKWELTLMLLLKTCLLLDSKLCLVDHGPCPAAHVKLGVDRWPTRSLANSNRAVRYNFEVQQFNSIILFYNLLLGVFPCT